MKNLYEYATGLEDFLRELIHDLFDESVVDVERLNKLSQEVAHLQGSVKLTVFDAVKKVLSFSDQSDVWAATVADEVQRMLKIRRWTREQG